MKRKPAEKSTRSLIKSISYRLLSITADTVAAFLLTRSVGLTLGIVIIANTYSTILYYFHERVWAKVRWGRIQTEY